MSAPQDDVERIVIRLDLSEPIERAIFERYQQKSRSRRQEWLREVLESGFVALGLSPAPVAAPALRQPLGGLPVAVAPASTAVSAAASVSSPLEVSASSSAVPADAGAAVHRGLPLDSSAPPEPAPAATPSGAERQPVSILKGFLPAPGPTLNRGTSS